MCWGFCSSTLKSQNSSCDRLPRSVAPRGRLIARPGRTARASQARLNIAFPGRPAFGWSTIDQITQLDPRTIASCKPMEGCTQVARPRITAGRHNSLPGFHTTSARACQPRAEAKRRSSTIASKRWCVPMLPAFAARMSPTATQPTRPANSGQTARASRSTARHVTRNVRTNKTKRPGANPRGRVTASMTINQPRWGLKASSASTKGSPAYRLGSCRRRSNGSRYAWSPSKL